MSSELPSLNGKQVIAALEKAGFSVARTKGSDHIMAKPGVGAVTVPVHRSKDLAKGTLRRIIKQAGLTVDEFRAYL